MPGGRPKSDPIKRFNAKVKVVESGCHEWQALLHRDGYGKFSYERKTIQSHRVAYMLFVGEIPKGKLVLHKCDNRKCVNLDHLYLGTSSDNAKDKVARFKGLWGRMKYTQEQIDECIRYRALGWSQQKIADKIGIDQTTVSRFIRGVYLKRN